MVRIKIIITVTKTDNENCEWIIKKDCSIIKYIISQILGLVIILAFDVEATLATKMCWLCSYIFEHCSDYNIIIIGIKMDEYIVERHCHVLNTLPSLTYLCIIYNESYLVSGHSSRSMCGTLSLMFVIIEFVHLLWLIGTEALRLQYYDARGRMGTTVAPAPASLRRALRVGAIEWVTFRVF